MRKIGISRYIFLVLVGILPMMGWGQTFKHYEGIANKSGDYEVIDASQGCLRQKTHECHYYVPMKSGASHVLPLPIESYQGSRSNNLEPRGYYRWYNYDTDMASSHLSVGSNQSLLQTISDGNGRNKGLFASNLNVYPFHKYVGVVYTCPTDANWTGETIACDVSRYVDGWASSSTSQIEHEPTLSIRYVFHIVPATKFADDVENAVLYGVGSKVNDLTYEDNKEMSVGLKDANSSFNLRVNENDVSFYAFHPMGNLGVHHVFYKDEKNKILPSYFDSNQVMMANNIMWRVYNSDKTLCHTYWKQGRFLTLSLNELNKTSNYDWYHAGQPKEFSTSRFYVW